jgi:hypothetical protein
METISVHYDSGRFIFWGTAISRKDDASILGDEEPYLVVR